MTFTQELYERISDALPDTTARRFSSYCGKSEGYYGSITAQKLPISTNSLIYLAEVIEHIIARRHNDYPHTAQKLRQVQQFIADEVARRTQDLPIDNFLVRKLILGAVASAAYQRDHQHNMPAIIFG